MTLTEFSYHFRRSLPYLILTFLFILIAFYTIQLIALFIQIQRPPTVHLNPIFDKIEAPKIPNAPTSAGLNFRLDNIEGQPVTATTSARVFFLPPQTARFGYREKIFLIARTLGFNTDTARYNLEGTRAKFTDDLRQLMIDITNFNFDYEYLAAKDPNLLKGVIAPTTQESQAAAVNFLQSMSRYPEELAQGEIYTSFFLYDPTNNRLTPQGRNINANVSEIDFYRPSIDGFPTISTHFPNSQNFVLLTITPAGPKILKGRINFFERSEGQVGVYPVKTGQQAYNSLKSGGGLILANPLNKKNIVIKKMFMAYFEPDSYQPYLEPVYVFLGEADFVAIVAAVRDDYLLK